jgi:ankyrin repeat protein
MSANQPIPLLYSGQAGQYFGTEYEGLPATVHSTVQALGQLLADRGLRYLGQLTCSQFANVGVYAYATADQRVAVTIMSGQSGLQGIDCVSKFADGSFLTTTTVKVLPGIYDKQRLFRVSFPGLTAVELLAQHLTTVQDLEQQYGPANSGFEDLLAIAQLVDEYTLRQTSNDDHGILEFMNGFAQGSMAQVMQAGSDDVPDDEDEDDEDDEDSDCIEYDEEEATPLVQAILQDDFAGVEQFLADGVELNPSGWNCYLPLVAAVFRGNPEIIQRLIIAGAKVDQLDCEINARPLGMAIKQNRPDLVQLLLDAGASPEGGDIEQTALSVAAEKANLALVQMLLAAGADPNAGMEDDYRVIMSAALNGHLEIVNCLVTHGADVNAWSQGETAIMSAARNGHQAVYDYLYPLLNEETRRHVDKHGPKAMARGSKSRERQANKLEEKLGTAAMYGNLAKVQQLLAEGAEANTITECGKSPLILAAMYGHKSTMAALLDAGADPNLGSDQEFEEGQTALMNISSSFFAGNRAEVIQFLADRGANLNAQDDKGRTALMMAGENADSVKVLLAAGADPNIRDHAGNTAMMLGSWAVQQLLRQAGASQDGLNDVALVEVTDLVKLEELIQAGANVNYGDGSALVSASGGGNWAIVDRLILAGADVNLGWKTGFTPIARAAYAGYFNVVERLLEAGADPFQRCHDGDYYDALEYAQMGKDEGNYKDRNYDAVITLLNRCRSAQ